MSKQKVIIRQESSPTVKEKREDEDGNVDGVIVEGLALPFKKESRNGVVYQKESIKNTYKSMEGNGILWNHDDSIMSYGHVEETYILEGEDAPAGDGMYYRANLDPNEEEFINKIERGDINSVSIQAFVDESEAEDNVVPVTEFLELSFVNIAGFPQTTTQKQGGKSPASAWGTPESVLAENLGIERGDGDGSDSDSTSDESLMELLMSEKDMTEEEAREWLDEAEERYSNKKEQKEDSDRTDNMGNDNDSDDSSQEGSEELQEVLESVQDSVESLEERMEDLEQKFEADDEDDDDSDDDDDEMDDEEEGSSKQDIGDSNDKTYNEDFRSRVKNAIREGKESEDN